MKRNICLDLFVCSLVSISICSFVYEIITGFNIQSFLRNLSLFIVFLSFGRKFIFKLKRFFNGLINIQLIFFFFFSLFMILLFRFSKDYCVYIQDFLYLSFLIILDAINNEYENRIIIKHDITKKDII